MKRPVLNAAHAREVDGNGNDRPRRGPRFPKGITDERLIAEWDPANDRSTADVTPGSAYRAIWRCLDCPYRWSTAVAERKRAGCPACAGRVATPWNCLAHVRADVAAEWSPTNELCADQVTAGSSAKARWECGKCSHTWEARISQRSRGSGCPSCAGRVVTERNCLATLYPEIAREWHPTLNEIAPTQITAKSPKKAWWLCCTCSHEWSATVGSRVIRGTGCGVCARLNSEPDRSIAYTHPHLLVEWDAERNTLPPMQLTPGSGRPVYWKCSRCLHRWSASPSTRARGHGCWACGSSTRGVASLGDARAFLHGRLVLTDPPDTAERLTACEAAGFLRASGAARALAEAYVRGGLDDQLRAFIVDGDDAEIARLLLAHRPALYGGKKRIRGSLRKQVFERDGHRCLSCGASKPLHVDHVIPEAMGGLTELENLQTLCEHCNSVKGSRIMSLDELRVLVRR